MAKIMINHTSKMFSGCGSNLGYIFISGIDSSSQASRGGLRMTVPLLVIEKTERNGPGLP